MDEFPTSRLARMLPLLELGVALAASAHTCPVSLLASRYLASKSPLKWEAWPMRQEETSEQREGLSLGDRPYETEACTSQ